MRQIIDLLQYIKRYKLSTALNILFNTLYTVFSFASIGFVMPFFDILFKADKPDIFKINQPKKVPINPYLSRLITLETSFAVTKLMNY